jgi:hypothetical protein
MIKIIDTPEMAETKTFNELAQIAANELEKIGDCVVICGPISTGGFGNVQANIDALNKTVRYFRGCGHVVFDNLIFEVHIARLMQDWKKKGNTGYCTPILEDFYQIVYQTGYIKKAFFLPNWETSFGATWERENLPKWDIEIVDISDELLKRIMSYFEDS